MKIYMDDWAWCNISLWTIEFSFSAIQKWTLSVPYVAPLVVQLMKDCFQTNPLQKTELKYVIMLMICGCIPLTSDDQAEIDHIRLMFFQIRVENLKRGPPGFKFFVYFDVIRSEDQSQCRILSQRGPPGRATVVLICSLDRKLYTTQNWVDPSFLFQP